jgi:putative transposase
MGVKTLAVTSDGQQFENHRFHKKSEKKVARLQKALSRKKSDSSNREKARLKLARAYERLCSQKNDTLQKMTTQLVREYDVICVRDEQVADMVRNRVYAKQLADAGWGAFTGQLEYKCDWYGKRLVKVSTWHPSTQLCSSCGERETGMRVKKYRSEWDCPMCGAHHDRNINAAVNILNEGTQMLLQAGLVEQTDT